MIWDSWHEDLHLFWLSFKHCWGPMDFLMSVEINIQILLLLAVRTPRTVKPSKKKLEADQDNEVFFTLRKKPHKVSIQCHEAVNLVLTQHVKWCERNIFKNMCSTVVISVLCGCCTRLLFPMFVCSSWSAWKCQCCSAGSWLNIKMLSYQDRKSHCGDKTVVRSSYLHNGISYTGKTASLSPLGTPDRSSFRALSKTSQAKIS